MRQKPVELNRLIEIAKIQSTDASNRIEGIITTNARLMTLLLLYRSGYMVGQYISIEKAIADTKEAYYDALQRADQGWHEGTNDPKPFIKYMLRIILSCYKEFEARVSIAYVSRTKSTSYDVVKAYVSERMEEGPDENPECEGICSGDDF